MEPYLTWGFQGQFLRKKLLVPFYKRTLALSPSVSCDSSEMPYSNNITERSVGMLPSSMYSEMHSVYNLKFVFSVSFWF